MRACQTDLVKAECRAAAAEKALMERKPPVVMSTDGGYGDVYYWFDRATALAKGAVEK